MKQKIDRIAQAHIETTKKWQEILRTGGLEK
jgi:hypothetical protein